MIPQSQSSGPNLQTVGIIERQLQYSVNQQQPQSQSCENMPEACANTATLNPPPYKE